MPPSISETSYADSSTPVTKMSSTATPSAMTTKMPVPSSTVAPNSSSHSSSHSSSIEDGMQTLSLSSQPQTTQVSSTPALTPALTPTLTQASTPVTDLPETSQLLSATQPSATPEITGTPIENSGSGDGSGDRRVFSASATLLPVTPAISSGATHQPSMTTTGQTSAGRTVTSASPLPTTASEASGLSQAGKIAIGATTATILGGAAVAAGVAATVKVAQKVRKKRKKHIMEASRRRGQPAIGGVTPKPEDGIEMKHFENKTNP